MENKSKVAICPKCNGLIRACHVDYLRKGNEKEFTELLNEGFTVKLETIPETQQRKFASYAECSKRTCNQNP